MNTTENIIDYSYKNFDGNKISGNEPTAKSFEGPSGKVSYKEIPLQYNYGTTETPIIDSCYFELPPVTSYGGIIEKVEQKPPRNPTDPPYIKKSYSMMFKFDIQDEECRECLEKLDALYMGSARVLGEFRGKVGLHHFDPTHPQGSYKNPIYYKIDSETFQRIEGHSPSMWVKLNHWTNNETLFTDPKENRVEWELLKNVEVKFIPLLHIDKVYIGNKPSLQIKLASAIVVDIAPLNTRTRQTATINKLNERHSNLADKVASQLAQVRMEKQDMLDTAPVDSNQHPAGEMHAVNNIQNDNSDLKEFLGGTPSMSQQENKQTTPTQYSGSSVTATPAPEIPQINFSSQLKPEIPQTVQLPSEGNPTTLRIQ